MPLNYRQSLRTKGLSNWTETTTLLTSLQLQLIAKVCARSQWHKSSSTRLLVQGLAWLTFCDELKIDVTCAMALAVSRLAATLLRKQLLTSDEHRKRSTEAPISAQSCNCLPTQITYDAPPLAHMTCEGEIWLIVYEFSYLYDIAKWPCSLSTTCRMLALFLEKSLCVHKPCCIWSAPMFTMTINYCLKCECMCVQNDLQTIIWRASNQGPTGVIPATMGITVRRSM